MLGSYVNFNGADALVLHSAIRLVQDAAGLLPAPQWFQPSRFLVFVLWSTASNLIGATEEEFAGSQQVWAEANQAASCLSASKEACCQGEGHLGIAFPMHY